MRECDLCDGVGYFSRIVCSDGCCGESRTCPACDGEGEVPSPVLDVPPWEWWDPFD